MDDFGLFGLLFRLFVVIAGAIGVRVAEYFSNKWKAFSAIPYRIKMQSFGGGRRTVQSEQEMVQRRHDDLLCLPASTALLLLRRPPHSSTSSSSSCFLLLASCCCFGFSSVPIPDSWPEMFGECGLFSWFTGRPKDRVGGSPEPVLLVSGMGGSILNARSNNNGSESRVWVRIILANLEFKRKLWSLYNHKTGYTKSLDPNIEIVVPEDDYGLYAIDILDPAWWVKCVHLTGVYHFHYLIDMLVKCGYSKGSTLFGYGYDFRQSIRTEELMDGLKVKLETAYKVSGGKKVNIISHSMGGLLVLCFLSLRRDVFEKYVNKWICVACPFQGAPGCINDSLLTGLQFVSGFESFLFVSRWAMHQLLVECPSVYEMLPNPDFRWKLEPLIQVWKKQSDSKCVSSGKLETFNPSESTFLFEEALRDNELTYDGKSVPLPFNASIFKWSTRTRKILSHAQLPDSVSFYNIFGTSFDTPFDVCYGSESSPVDDYSEICHSMPNYSFVDGDGTVPAESAKADGLEATARVGIQASHRGLLNNEKVFECIRQWLGVDETRQLRKPKYARKVADVLFV